MVNKMACLTNEGYESVTIVSNFKHINKESVCKTLGYLRMFVPAAHSSGPVIDYIPRSCRNGTPSLMVRDIKWSASYQITQSIRTIR